MYVISWIGLLMMEYLVFLIAGYVCLKLFVDQGNIKECSGL